MGNVISTVNQVNTQFTPLVNQVNTLQGSIGTLRTDTLAMNNAFTTLRNDIRATIGALQSTIGALFLSNASMNQTLTGLSRATMTLGDNYNPNTGMLKLANWSLQVTNGNLSILSTSGSSLITPSLRTRQFNIHASNDTQWTDSKVVGTNNQNNNPWNIINTNGELHIKRLNNAATFKIGPGENGYAANK